MNRPQRIARVGRPAGVENEAGSESHSPPRSSRLSWPACERPQGGCPVAAWINHRFLGLPTTIGVMVLALLASLVVVTLAPAGLREEARAALERIDFSHALLDVLLAFLLFAGALHVKVDQLYERKWVIGVLATVGVLVSTFVVGGTVLAALTLLGFDVEFIDCLIFGALISPRDRQGFLRELANLAPRR